MQGADEVVGGVGQQDAEHHIELKSSHESSAPLCGSKFSDVYRAQHGRCTNAKTADAAEDQERRPVPREAASQGRGDVEQRRQAQGFAAAEPLAHLACAQRADYGAHQSDGYRESFILRAQSIEVNQRINCARDDNCVEAEEQATQGPGERGFHQFGIGSHRELSLKFQTIVQTGAVHGKAPSAAAFASGKVKSGTGCSRWAGQGLLCVSSGGVAGSTARTRQRCLSAALQASGNLALHARAIARLEHLVHDARVQAQASLEHINHGAGFLKCVHGHGRATGRKLDHLRDQPESLAIGVQWCYLHLLQCHARFPAGALCA